MFSARELATVLAALRHWQHQLARFFADEEPLSVAEIDNLYYRVNDVDTGGDSQTA